MDLSRWADPSTSLGPRAWIPLWNDSTPEAIARRVDSLIRAGFGGAVLEPGKDAATPPLEPSRWPALLRAAAESAEGARDAENRRNGFDLWVGPGAWEQAAALVLERDPATRARVLCIERGLGMKDAREQAARDGNAVGAYCLALATGLRINGLEPLELDGESTPEDASDLTTIVRAKPLAPDAAAASLDRLDLLQRDVTRTLCEALQAMLGLCDKTPLPLSGVAVAMPGQSHEKTGAFPWTPGVFEVYRQRWGEDPRDRLPLLWFQGPGWEAFRWRYRTLIAETLRTNFLETIDEWRQEVGLKAAGPFGPGQSLLRQIAAAGGPLSAFFGSVGSPVVYDPAEAASSVFAFRQASSVAQQALHERENPARRAVADVLPGAGGRIDQPADIHQNAARALALGAGHLVAGAAPLSLARAGRRASFGAALDPAQPWWPHMPAVCAGISRLLDLMRQGNRRAPVLVLSPADSLVALADTPLPESLASLPGATRAINERAREIERPFEQILQALSAQQIDFDLADDDTLARLGATRRNAFFVGDRDYDTVIVPPAFSWRSDTLRLLKRFVTKGGCVIAAPPLATFCDFEPEETLERLSEEYANVFLVERAGREVCFQLNRLDPKPCLIRPRRESNLDSLLVNHRRTESHDLFCILNESPKDAVHARLWLYADGPIRVLDPWRGDIRHVAAEDDRNAQRFDFTFEPGRTTVFAVGGEPVDLTEPECSAAPAPTAVSTIPGPWGFERFDPNYLPLVYCRAGLAGESLSREQPVAFHRVAAAADDTTPQDADDSLSNNGGPGETGARLLFRFDSELEGNEREFLVLFEDVEGLRLDMNGQDLQRVEDYCPLGDGFAAYDAAPALRPDQNELVLHFPEGSDPVFESPILAGDFAVRIGEDGRGTLVEEPEALEPGDWTRQGYPYYAGRLRLRVNLQEEDLEPEGQQDLLLSPRAERRYFLKFGRPGCSLAAVRVGRHESLLLDGPPWGAEVTRQLDGEPRPLEIELAASLRNLLGPVHTAFRLWENPGAPPTVYDQAPAADRRLWNRVPQLLPFGAIGGLLLEIFDPKAPKKKEKRETASPSGEDDQNGLEEEGTGDAADSAGAEDDAEPGANDSDGEPGDASSDE